MKKQILNDAKHFDNFIMIYFIMNENIVRFFLKKLCLNVKKGMQLQMILYSFVF